MTPKTRDKKEQENTKKTNAPPRKQWRVSVRSFVEFLLKSGDIDQRRGSAPDVDAMQLGSRLHRYIQGRQAATYRSEVTLREVFDLGACDLIIEGRADGIDVTEEGIPLIDEIKGIYADPEKLKEPVPVHLAQAKVYACIYARQQEVEEVAVQMTYGHLETRQIRRFHFSYTAQELNEWLLDLVETYRKWVDYDFAWKQERDISCREIEFPYAYREGQRRAVASVYHTITTEKKLFLQAPTGVGKTSATIFPGVKAVGEGRIEKIFYLTAKTIARTVAQETFDLLRQRGLQYKTVTLTAKEKICPEEEVVCNPDACEYAKGHFDRINEAVFDLWTSRQAMTREVILEYAKKHRVCPFELELEVSLWVDGVICDYNYLFDPKASLRRFFSDDAKEKYLFLIDEAHNLVDRGRGMYSAVLVKEDFLALATLVQEEEPKLAKALRKASRQMVAWKRECEDVLMLPELGSFALTLLNIMGRIEAFFDEEPEMKLREACLELYFAIRHFVAMEELLDDHYRIYTSYTDRGDFYVKLFCIDPSNNLASYLDKGVATVFFSATLLPIRYYKKLLGATQEDYAIYATSPFPVENRLVLRGRNVTTKYAKRSETMYRRYAMYILAAMQSRGGNYLAFFPSYEMLRRTAEIFAELAASIDGIDMLCQDPQMTEEEREDFLEAFSEEEGARRMEDGTRLVGFCVMGGAFAEGIDLARDALIGVIIVGTGLPSVSTEQDILREYFDEQGLSGFDYAYLYTGMNRVLQAAGRVIRTEEDRGFIMLLDDRFAMRSYVDLYPREWTQIKSCEIEEVANVLDDFWAGDLKR